MAQAHTPPGLSPLTTSKRLVEYSLEMKTVQPINTPEKEACEQSTGCCEHKRGIGQFYSGPINRKGSVSESGSPLTDEEALAFLIDGGSVAVPNAGAGSYRAVFARLGYSTCIACQTCSSAGDWTLVICDGSAVWHFAFQENRYPRCGFLYSIDFRLAFDSKEAAYAYLDSL